MATEILGVPSTDPNDNSNIGYDGDGFDGEVAKNILGIFGNTKSLVQYSEKVVNNTDKIVDILVSNNKDLTASISNTNQGKNSTALIENTQAIIALTEQIKKSTNITLDIKGTGGNFFSAFISASTNENKIKAVDKFGDVFASVVTRIADLSDKAKGIEKLAGSLVMFFGSFKEVGKGLAFASAGLALFGLSIITFVDAITFEHLFKFVGIMTAIRIGTEIIGKATWDLAKITVSIALLGLAIYSFNELITVDMATNFAFVLGMAGLGIKTFSYLTGGVGSMKNVALAVGVIGLLGGAIWAFNKGISNLDDFDMEVFSKTMIAVGIAGGVMYLMGKGAIQIGIGALASVAVAGGLYALGYGLTEFLSVPRSSLDNAVDIGIASGIALGVLALIGGTGAVALAIGVGALAVGAVGGALWALSKGLMAITAVEVTKKQAENFATGVGYAVDGLIQLANPLLGIGLAVATPVALALSASTLAVTGALWAIQKLPLLELAKFKNFTKGLEMVVDSYGGMSTRKVLKAGLFATAMTPIVGLTGLSVLMLRGIQALEIKPERIQNFMNGIGIVIDSYSDIFDRNKSKLKSVRKGIISFMGIHRLTKTLADSVSEIANLMFVERKYVNGEFKIVGSRPLNENDFEGVGKSIGKLLNALTDPLSKIGDQKDQYKIGGFTVTNPFSNKVKSGIKAMSNIGSIFTPLSEMVKTFSINGIDNNFVAKFNGNLSGILGGIGDSFLANEDGLKRAGRIKLGQTISTIKELTQIVGNDKFSSNVDKFHTFTTDIELVKNTMNAFDIEKLTKFSGMIANLNEMTKLGAITELVETFNEFLEKFTDFITSRDEIKEEQTIAMTPTQQIGAVPSLAKPIPLPIKQDTKEKVIGIEEFTKLHTSMENLRRLFLDGTAKVKIEGDRF